MSENIRLRKLEEQDAPLMLEWMKDREIQRGFRFDASQKDINAVADFIRDANIVLCHGKDIHYAVCDERDEYLGTISLKDIDLINKKAEYAISLRKIAQGKGIASQATHQILRLAFEKYGLERVYLNVLDNNIRAIHFYEKFGFVYEGEFRKDLFLRGEFRTLRWYSLLKDEFQIMSIGGGQNLLEQ